MIHVLLHDAPLMLAFPTAIWKIRGIHASKHPLSFNPCKVLSESAGHVHACRAVRGAGGADLDIGRGALTQLLILDVLQSAPAILPPSACATVAEGSCLHIRPATAVPALQLSALRQ